MLWLKENFVYFRKRPCVGCAKYIRRFTSESSREQSQIIYSVCLCCFVFEEAPMKGNYWQTGGVEVAFSFSLFGRFPDFLPLGQQYLPLNRKPRIWLPVVDYPRARGRVAGAGLNARGLWERDWCTHGFFRKCACSRESCDTFFHQFFIVNFSKSSRTTYVQFFNIGQHRSSDNFSSKSVRQILRYSYYYYYKIPSFDISVDIQKVLLQIFVLTCKDVYFDPKFKWYDFDSFF